MRLTMMAAALAGALGTAGIAAQDEPGDDRAHDVYILTGCLEAGDAGTEQFLLTDAAATGTPPPETSQSEAPSTYHLEAVSGLFESGVEAEELTRHLGLRVEVTVRPPEVVPLPEISPGVSREGEVAIPETTVEPPPTIFSVSAIEAQGGECV